MPLTFHSTVRSFTVSVPISDDNLLEVDEDFFGNLRVLDDPSGLVVLDPAVASATIIDNDSKISNYEVLERLVSHSVGFRRESGCFIEFLCYNVYSSAEFFLKNLVLLSTKF